MKVKGEGEEKAKVRGEGEQRKGENPSVNLQPPTSTCSTTFNLQPLLAVLLSLLFHGLIAAGIALYIGYAPAPDELAQLDLTSVDLSFAETPDETAAAVPASAPMPTMPPSKPKEPESAPPEEAKPVDPLMPAPDTSDLPKPDETSEKFEAHHSSLVTPNSSPVAPRQARVDAPPKPRRNIKPDYPRESRQRGEQGDVTLEIDVNAQGAVDDVRVAKSSGFPLLDEAAVKAARAARFTPAKSDGKPVSSTARLTLNFQLK